MDRDGLADFLRRRRAALRPEELGIAVGSRRRTRGLRREEVAARAHISTDFYTRLEQRRGARPSASTVASLAVALRLDRIERNHLFALAGHNAPATTVRRDEPSPGLLRVLERIDGAPAMIVSDLGVTRRQNRLSEALLGDHSVHSGLARSMVYRWFTEPERRALHPAEDHAVRARQHVASLRAVYGRPGPDPEAEELVAALLAASEEFAALWERHEVGSRQASDKRFVHPLVGELTLDCQILTPENVSERLVVFSAAPGSVDEARLGMLAELATAPVG
ncbi:MAG: helix-turn-helix domain-containing protein [Actinobacteria bacterium]|nr:helix-turn-helix domain-containing protein [Actinomycetota bacterium]